LFSSDHPLNHQICSVISSNYTLNSKLILDGGLFAQLSFTYLRV